ncbi:transglutaminase-like domain-containing protein [Pseudoalteromonas sp. S16_S37]|uniref:transglutaminase-like domain-containing protein n=1 Tax=Pseudoalteromonas sp. S16_S37 TaxID=2720228 RepID=UPI001681B7D0|nr:transglutaminase family protein [Pseudoalteromonas sp. S16_S37]MBD1582115.1 transglutaminase family protein [Pseudoalteromonas sp. S16_S37]
MQEYLSHSHLLDFNHPDIQALIASRAWHTMDQPTALKAIYDYVKDEILFGYSAKDTLKASEVLQDGYGQCNTKGTLLMALLRAVGIPCRLQGFKISNNLKSGVMPSWILNLAPKEIIHSWVEVFIAEQWLELEGYIIDKKYLSTIQQRFRNHQGTFIGYGIATPCLQSPNNEFNGTNTYIQKESIIKSLGHFNEPDSFYSRFSNLTGIKKWLYRYILRHIINLNIKRFRKTSNIVDNNIVM